MSDTAKNPNLLVESRIVDIDSVRPNTWNPNEFEDSVFQFLKKSITKHGFVVPIIVTKDHTIIDGEHRWKAMKESGATQIEVKVLDLSDEEAMAETINFDMLRGKFNQEKLAKIVRTLTKDKAVEDVEKLLVMRQKEVDKLVGKFYDSAPDVRECTVPVDDFRQIKTDLKRGDLVLLGDHRIMCGDASNFEDVSYLFGPERADLCVTSPPYYNQREYSQWETYQDFLDFCGKVVSRIKDIANESSFVCCWNMGSSESEHEFIPADNYYQFKHHGFEWIEWIVWKKQCAQWNIPRSQHIDQGLYIPALRWESICVFLLGDRPRFNLRDIKKVREWQENLWEMQKVLGNQQRDVGHPAMFPIELPYRCILSFSQDGALVYEPFAGSGQTLLAAEQTGRRCFAMELEPKYVELTAQRWEAEAGRIRTVYNVSEE